jgi:formylglycine-generating enzyme required for sulfatase activity
MRHFRKFILPSVGGLLLLGFCSVAWLSHTASAQISPLTYPQIITALNTPVPNDAFKTKAQLIAFLIADVRKRKVDKPLTDDREDDLRQAGATDELIEVIRANSPASRPTPTPVPTRTPPRTPTPTPGTRTLPKQIRNSIGMEFVLIPPGAFVMGSSKGERDRNADEGPQHPVSIKYGFYMGKFEVTQGQWKAVMGRPHAGMNGLDPEFIGDDLPVVRISWNDAKMFVDELNSKDSVLMYRLPSEAEWEYTARAGTKTRFFWGDDPKFRMLCKYANVKDFSDCPDGSKRTAHVRSYAPNAFGLHNMTGNVWEWCLDIYQDSYQNTPTDGAPNLTAGAKRVQRGASWADEAKNARVAVRGGDLPTDRNDEDGFRLVAAPKAVLFK